MALYRSDGRASHSYKTRESKNRQDLPVAISGIQRAALIHVSKRPGIHASELCRLVGYDDRSMAWVLSRLNGMELIFLDRAPRSGLLRVFLTTHGLEARSQLEQQVNHMNQYYWKKPMPDITRPYKGVHDELEVEVVHSCAGDTSPKHSHPFDEYVFVAKSTITLERSGIREKTLHDAPDFVQIPAGVPHVICAQTTPTQLVIVHPDRIRSE